MNVVMIVKILYQVRQNRNRAPRELTAFPTQIKCPELTRQRGSGPNDLNSTSNARKLVRLPLATGRQSTKSSRFGSALPWVNPPSALTTFPYGFPSAINVKQDSCQHSIILEIYGISSRLGLVCLCPRSLLLASGEFFQPISARNCLKLRTLKPT
jgi:hypothetical protein